MSIKKISVIQTGNVAIRPQHVEGNGFPVLFWLLTSRKWTAPRPINVYVIEHDKGLVLFDTGQDRHSITDSTYFPRGFIGFLYKRLAKFTIRPEETLTAQLKKLGYQPSDVKYAVLSHLHQDHIGGISKLPSAKIIVNKIEWDQLNKPLHTINGYLVRHIDLPEVEWKKIILTNTNDSLLSPFTESYDIFGDNSLVIVSTPGHTPGSVSMLLRQKGLPPMLFVGDVTYDSKLLSEERTPGVGKIGALKKTTAMINTFKERYPKLIILAAHDPAAQKMLRLAVSEG